MIYVLIFTISMMIKGGWLGRIKQWKKWETRRKEIIEDLDTPIHKEFFTNIADWLLDGTQLSSFFLFTGLCAAQPDMLLAGLIALAWNLVVRISMGEEGGGVGNYHEAYGDYIQWLGDEDGRRFAFKKGVQYGATFGGALALASGNVSFIVAGALFPIAYYIGNSIHYFFHKQGSVAYSEIIWGALFGLAWAS